MIDDDDDDDDNVHSKRHYFWSLFVYYDIKLLGNVRKPVINSKHGREVTWPPVLWIICSGRVY